MRQTLNQPGDLFPIQSATAKTIAPFPRLFSQQHDAVPCGNFCAAIKDPILCRQDYPRSVPEFGVGQCTPVKPMGKPTKQTNTFLAKTNPQPARTQSVLPDRF